MSALPTLNETGEHPGPVATPWELLADIIRPSEVFEADLTPEMARRLLEQFNTTNRKLIPARAAILREEMEDGRWDHRANVIAFRADSPALGDGQHRLAAIAAMPDGSRVRVSIRFDWDDDTVVVCDQVKPRTAKDIASVLGVVEPGADVAFSAIRYALTLERSTRSAIPRPWIIERYRNTPHAAECGVLGRTMGALYQNRAPAAMSAFVLMAVVRHHGIGAARSFVTAAIRTPHPPVFKALAAHNISTTVNQYGRQAELVAIVFDMWRTNPRVAAPIVLTGIIPAWVRG